MVALSAPDVGPQGFEQLAKGGVDVGRLHEPMAAAASVVVEGQREGEVGTVHPEVIGHAAFFMREISREMA
jgi:hypothetical protein